MPKYEIKFSNYFKLPNPGLRAYYEHVVRGQPDEYRTPFYKGKPVAKILQGWDATLATIKNDWPSLYSFEVDLRKKVGPMSIMKPLSERMKDVDSYYESILLDSKPVSPLAIDAVIGEWGSKVGGLLQRGQARTVDVMKKSTNSGSPYFTKRKLVTKDTIPCEVYTTNGVTFQKLTSSDWNACAVLGWRGQEGGPDHDDVKQRVVWMFPYAINIRELQVYQPLTESFQKFSLVPAWVSMDKVDEEVTLLFDTKGASDLIIGTDFSKFDQHFNSEMQLASKSILARLLVDDVTNREWLETVFPIKYNIPLAIDIGKIKFGAHGMGSGSGGTNADETLAHRALQYEAAQSVSKILNPHSQCLGDDGIISYPGCTVDDVMQAYTAHGLEMNEDKQYASTQDCVYLRRWHHENYRLNGVCVGVYSTYRALGRLAEQERYYDPEIWGPKMVALRQLSILENVKYHPLNKEFVQYCMKGDKYRLGLDIPGFLANIESEAREAIDYMPDFLGYTKSMTKYDQSVSGIGQWWVVKYLKSLA